MIKTGAGNFIYNAGPLKDGVTSRVTVIDVGSMHWSVAGKKGKSTGSADVARLLGSLESLAPSALSHTELTTLRNSFHERYRAAGAGHLFSKAAARWYQLQMELAIVRGGSDTEGQLARSRIMNLVKEVDR